MYLSYRSNKENTCFPAIKTISRECGMGVSTVKRALMDLCDDGYIRKDSRYRADNGQTSNLYTLVSEVAVEEQEKEESLDSKMVENEIPQGQADSEGVHFKISPIYEPGNQEKTQPNSAGKPNLPTGEPPPSSKVYNRELVKANLGIKEIRRGRKYKGL